MKLTSHILLLGAILLLSACDKETSDYNSLPRNSNPIALRFVDYAGHNLIDKLPLTHFEERRYGLLERPNFTIRAWVNGKEAQIPDVYYHLMAFPDTGTIGLDLNGLPSVVGWWEDYYTFTYHFSCPAIYGDDTEHVFVVEKKGSNLGKSNNAEYVFYDGKMMASHVENGKDTDQIPIVITVPYHD